MTRINSTLDIKANRRKIADRRAQDQQRLHDHRVRPDRRLSNISVEWIPIWEVTLRPDIREPFCSPKNNNQPTETQRSKPLSTGLFENQWCPTVDRRKGTDRRTRQEKHPYNRRVHPDRRLNNIFMEWISY
jgi:hypothetical protein